MPPDSPLDSRNVNSLWASVLVETLARGGLRHAVVSPGSRSAPLTFAFARQPAIATVPVLDERSAGFFALGIAKQTGQPVALLCTSGTAAANYFPAIIEAHESRVPLLVLTADRPPELRACAAGQTIDQQKIFGGFTEFFNELAMPEADAARFAYLRQTVAHAHARALHAGGPVHLNVPFRDPLAPSADDGAAAKFAGAINWETFFAPIGPTTPSLLLAPVPPLVTAVHGVIVAGPLDSADAARDAAII
ncbi:MAG: hypothetical protein RLZZ15_4586, partial [Verrucomicrobiota bacterium]